jgi:peptide/nickel transport system substrate-binding protein
VELDLEANPNYYSKPKTPYIVVRFFSDSTTLRLALERGDVDVVLRGLTATDIVDFKNKPSDFKVKEFPGIRIGIFMLNLKHPPFDNILVRRALAYVVDRKAIVEKVFFNTSEPCYSLVPRGWFTHVDAFKEKYGEYGEIGLETARDLLRAAGYNETNKLIFDLYYTPTQYGKEEGDMAIVLKENFERTEMISVNLKNEEWSTFMEHLAKSTLPTLIIHWSPDYYDPDTYLYALLHSGTYISEAFGYSNPEIDSLLDHGRVAPTNERGVIYEQVQRLASEEAWIIPTIQEKVTAVSKSNVEGIVATEIMDWEFQFVEVTK